MEKTAEPQAVETRIPRRVPLGFRLLFAVLGLYMSCLLLAHLAKLPIPGPILSSFEAGMVGGLCDSVAILMLFKRRAWIPKSGLIARNMESFSAEVASTVEAEMLSPESLRRHLSAGAGQRLQERLRALFEENPEAGRAVTRKLAAVLSEEMGRPDFLRGFFSKLFPEEHPAALFIAALDWEKLAPKVRESLREKATDLVSPQRLLEALPADGLDAWVGNLAGALIPRGTVQQLVQSQLRDLGPDGVAEMMERRAGRHLDNIRVNGVVFGSILGFLLGCLRLLGES